MYERDKRERERERKVTGLILKKKLKKKKGYGEYTVAACYFSKVTAFLAVKKQASICLFLEKSDV